MTLIDGHLGENAIEALANDREDLVDESILDHLDVCEVCAAWLAEERRSTLDAQVGLRRVHLPSADLDAMILRALDVAEAPQLAPSRLSLGLGAAVGGLLAVALGIASMPTFDALHGLSIVASQGATLLRALDRVIESSVPGGWASVALGALLVALVSAVPAQYLSRRVPLVPRGLSTGVLLVVTLGGLLLPVAPASAYRLEGAWPDPVPAVAVSVEGAPTSEALRQAARSAGLGLVVRLDEDPPVTMHVSGVPIDQVVDALLGDRPVVVRPGEQLLTVRWEEGDTRPVATDLRPPPLPAPAPVPLSASSDEQLRDLVTFGQSADVSSGQQVRGVYTMGGDARVLGRALGDVVTMGGDAVVDGEVVGNITTMGGDIRLGPSARVHGDINAMGGELDVPSSARVYGRRLSDDPPESSGPAAVVAAPRQMLAAHARWALWNALVFLCGLVLMGAAPKRIEALRTQVSSRPLRSALGGVVALVLGSLLMGILTITIIGIPVALALGVALTLCGVVGWSASAWWLGSALPFDWLKRRPVARLVAGTTLLFLLGLVPTVGTLIVMGVAIVGFGAVVATRLGRVAPGLRSPAHTPTGPFAERS